MFKVVIASVEAYLPLRKNGEERLVALQSFYEFLGGRGNAAVPTSSLNG